MSAPQNSVNHTNLFYQAVLHLFGKLVKAADESDPPPLPRTVLDKYMTELYRFHLWGDEFSESNIDLDRHLANSAKLHDNVLLILEQLSRALRLDLVQALAPRLVPDEALNDAINNVALLQTSISKYDERVNDGDLDWDNESLAGSESSNPSWESILDDIIIYIDCLMDLLDVLNSPTLGTVSGQNPSSGETKDHNYSENPDPDASAVAGNAKNYCLKVSIKSQSDPDNCTPGASQWKSSHGSFSISDQYLSSVPTNMKDQPWMWVLGDAIILVSFPQTYYPAKEDISGTPLQQSITRRLEMSREKAALSIYELALVVFEECLNTPYDSSSSKSEEIQRLTINKYFEAIGALTDQHHRSFQHVWQWTQKASILYRAKKLKNINDSHLDLQHLATESDARTLLEVERIIHELIFMIDTQKQHLKALSRFCNHVKDILDPEEDRKGGHEPETTRDEFAISLDGAIAVLNRGQNPLTEKKPVECLLKPPDKTKTQSERLGGKRTKNETKENKNTKQGLEKELLHKLDDGHSKPSIDLLIPFNLNSQEVLLEFQDRIDELEGLKKGAESTFLSIKHLLDLKKQQADVVAAWESVKQAERALLQARKLQILTMAAFLFLPLCFVASIYGMNTGNDPITLVRQSGSMILVPSAIILVTTICFFHSLKESRAFGKALFTYIWRWIKSQIYWILHEIREGWSSSSTRVRKTAEETIQKIKQDMERIRNTQRRKVEGKGKRRRARSGVNEE
ncbi:hypothetical protein QBC38DRAFT_487320 [Podospora fimiseda]|uniref:Ankyrin repeat protein n=1 Tax=Podospora fimiseda TaxID=252190 RepID=A0AAN7GVA1_9PEZI|nr:hypothetical protein QBC38DRAFT_487320 [Podospora fimiseda]